MSPSSCSYEFFYTVSCSYELYGHVGGGHHPVGVSIVPSRSQTACLSTNCASHVAQDLINRFGPTFPKLYMGGLSVVGPFQELKHTST